MLLFFVVILTAFSRSFVSCNRRNIEDFVRAIGEKNESEVFNIIRDEGRGIVNEAAADGTIPLLKAIEVNDLKIVDLLLANDADLSVRDVNRNSPLHLVTKSSLLPVFLSLLTKGADRKARNADGLTALHLAAEENDLDLVYYLMKDKSDEYLRDFVNMYNRKGETAFHWAARAKNEEILKLLMNYVTDLNGEDSAGKTALHHAAMYNSYRNVEFLLECVKNAEVTDYSGNTALHLCAASNTEFKPKLLRACSNSKTPQYRFLKDSENKESRAIADLLLKRGFDRKAVNAAKETPLDVAKKAANKGVIKRLRWERFVTYKSIILDGDPEPRKPASNRW